MVDPELKDNNREDTGEGFVRERIVNKSSSKRVFRKLLLTGVCAVLFGLVAGVTLAAVLPMASGWFETEAPAPSITVPKDNMITPDTEEPTQASTEETQPSTELEVPTEGATEEPSTEVGMTEDEVREMIERMLREGYNEQSADPLVLKSLYQALASLGRGYNKAIVTVEMKGIGTDWFENEVETSGQCAGVIWNELEDGTLYIMSCGTIPAEGAGLQVLFANGVRRDAELCQVDQRTGLMVLKVSGENVDVELREKIEVLALGNSYTVNTGSLVLALGGPVGDVGAIIPAAVTYAGKNIIDADTVYRRLYLDCTSVEGANGFVVTLDGAIVGLITPETSGSVTSMIGISDLKGVIELLANGQRVPYLGILGQTVTEEIKETYSLPSGVYVNEAEANSPVYKAGIKAGDVIIRINGTDVLSLNSMRNVIEELEPGMEVTVTVKRAANGEYQELTFTMVPGVR